MHVLGLIHFPSGCRGAEWHPAGVSETPCPTAPRKASVEAVTRISFTSRESFLEINSCKGDLAGDIFVLAVVAHYAEYVVPRQPQKHGRLLASSVWEESKLDVHFLVIFLWNIVIMKSLKHSLRFSACRWALIYFMPVSEAP